MPINFNSALGIHAQALLLRSRRNELLASNIANADTPGYKARDLDFRTILSRAKGNTAVRLRLTNERHLATSAGGGVTEADIQYRIPNQSSLDGNTVDPNLEKAAFSENALRYNASLTFLDRKFKGLMKALKGE
ncbi:MAG TPA: flagellar basal body rod protein FlgB [Chromatiaceae bacterium]|nr:flagellar basal body rod protein FlgB [Chromatiaceae bacterium]